MYVSYYVSVYVYIHALLPLEHLKSEALLLPAPATDGHRDHKLLELGLIFERDHVEAFASTLGDLGFRV